MTRRQLIGLVGAAILFIGAFLPIVSLPIAGNINYIQNGRAGGLVLIGLALLSLGLVLVKRFEEVFLAACGAILPYDYGSEG